MNNSSITDTELVRQYISGSENALEEIIARHKDRIYGYIKMMVKSHDLAEDVFQDTFIKAIKTLKAGNYNEEGKFLPWIMRIAHNLLLIILEGLKECQLIVEQMILTFLM